MKYNFNYDMAITENPYIDLLVQCVKILGMNSVVKNENEALHYEDIRSAAEADKLIKYKKGLWNDSKYGYFNEKTYMEWNSYYRMLNGLPPAYSKNDEDAYLQAVNDTTGECMKDIGIAWIIPELYERYFINMEDYIDYIPSDMTALDLKGKYLHELSVNDLSKIEACGIMDMIRDDDKYKDPHYEYIYHLGDKRVDFYTARTAENFSLLFCPKLNTFDIIEQKYKRYFERNRQYSISTIYSEAYRFMSYHYDAFIIILLIIQTMVDLLMEVQEYIINKDVFDNRTVRYLFESYGIDYYKEIPINYQIRIIKNVNKLLKYKSSNRNITDIIELFDSPDITVYTYYLMKVKKLPKSEFKYYTENDIDPKYGTNKDYYLGNPNDRMNNRYPLMDHSSEEIDYAFLSKYLFTISNNKVVDSKIASMYRNMLLQYFNKVNYYNIDATEDEKENYLTNMQIQLMNYLYDNIITLGDKYINKYNYRFVKFRLYTVMGLLPEYSLDQVELLTDEEILNKLYTNNTIVNNEYILNSTIPFFIGNEFEIDKYYIINGRPFTTVNPDKGQIYDEYLKIFRELYYKFITQSIEYIFSDINNRYDGWIDSSYILSQLGNDISINNLVTTKGLDEIPIYSNHTIDQIIDSSMVGKEYFTKNYDLCFLRVPLLDPNAYKCIEDHSNRRNYDQITYYSSSESKNKSNISGDPFWDGVSTHDLLTDEERDKLHQSKKNEILNKDFTIERTKYIAVEASIDLTKMSYQISYFLNMLYDRHIDEESLTLDVDNKLATGPVKLSDLLIFAIALNYLHNGVAPDNIASDMERNLFINGFNFDTDWVDIYNSLENHCKIYNNYLNEKHDYSYTDEYGNTHNIKNGYGVSPMNKGFLTELYNEYYMYTGENKLHFITYNMEMDDYDKEIGYYSGNKNGNNSRFPDDGDRIKDNSNIGPLYPDTKVGAFLSGRYEKCKKDSLYITYDECEYTQSFKNMLPSEMGKDFNFGYSDIWNYNLKRLPIYDIEGNEFSTIDVTWNTQYKSMDNNSHGLFLNTNIFNKLTNATSDLEKYNLIKAIYMSNTNLYNHLTYMMRHAESKRMYDIYNTVFESYMETRMNHEFYNVIDSNGNYIYEDENNNTYTIKSQDRLIVNGKYIPIGETSNGFPDFYGYNWETGKQYRYEFIHNSDFTYCKYINIDTKETVECIRDGQTKDYEVFEDTTGQISRVPNLYLHPTKEGIRFELAFETVYYLEQNNARGEDPNIIIIDSKKENNKTIPIIPDNFKIRVAKDYYEFLQYRNSELYTHLIDLKYNYKNIDDKKVRIEELCEYISIALEQYFDKKEWKYIFNLIPTANIENVQSYILKMVMFFKSWKTQTLTTAVDYIINDPWQNHIHILDDLYYNSDYKLKEKVRPKEFIGQKTNTKYSDKINVKEKPEFNYEEYKPYTYYYAFIEKMYGDNFDFPELGNKIDIKSNINIKERLELTRITNELPELVVYEPDCYVTDKKGISFIHGTGVEY